LSSGWLLVQAEKAKAHNRIIADFFIVLILNMVAKIKKNYKSQHHPCQRVDINKF
jgi:hypothetical protein